MTITHPPTATTPEAVPAYAGPPARPRRRLATLLVASSLSAMIGAGAGIGSYGYVMATDGAAAAPISVTTVPAADTERRDGTISAAAATIDPSVVTIAVRSPAGSGIGTGVILDTDGHILTNNHVVESAAQGGRVTVTLSDGSTARATIVGRSPSNDLAVIKVDGSAKLTPATFATSSSVKVGQAVVAVGAPLGLSKTVTSGIVSNTARPVRSGSDSDSGPAGPGSDKDAVYLALQTDAAINPGNSGGPLVDLNGSVVGINSSIASTGSGAGNIGIGFAIPADIATRVAGDLISSGSSVDAAIGVTVGAEEIDGSESGISTVGVTLQSVLAGGAAEQAGLRAGDRVTKLNDYFTTTPDGLIAAVRRHAPGTTVEVTYVRDDKTRTARVTLGKV